MPTPFPRMIPKIFHWGTLKCENDDVDHHPEDGQESHAIADPVQPLDGKYPDVQNENGDNDAGEGDVPRRLMDVNCLQMHQVSGEEMGPRRVGIRTMPIY